MVPTIVVSKKFFKNKKNKIFKISKIEKLKIQDFCHIRAYVRAKDEKFVLFPDVDAVKRQEMPNLPLFSVSDGFKLENGIVIRFASRNTLRWLKNGFCCFLRKITKQA